MAGFHTTLADQRQPARGIHSQSGIHTLRDDAHVCLSPQHSALTPYGASYGTTQFFLEYEALFAVIEILVNYYFNKDSELSLWDGKKSVVATCPKSV